MIRRSAGARSPRASGGPVGTGERELDRECGEEADGRASDAEAARLNAEWRRKDYAPNILSFPAPEGRNVPEGEPRPLGDLILAVGTVAREAEEQGKPLTSHLTHLIVHGTLHLLGFDHIEERDALRMEKAEIAILAGLGVRDPYNA